MPAQASGRRTVKKARAGPAPRVRAARISVGSTPCSAARAFLTTKGRAPMVAATTAPVLVKTMLLPVSDSKAMPMALRRPMATSR
jgi:hypothetical protein